MQKAIVPGSSDATVEGRQYYRDMRINKKTFCVLAQYRVKELTNGYNDKGMVLKLLFWNLRRKPTVENLKLILSNNEFQIFFWKNSK